VRTLQERKGSEQENGDGLSVRAVILGCVLAALFTLVNSYLNINFGMGLGFGVVTILLAYVLFHKVLGGSNRREIALAWVLAGSSLSAAFSFGFLIYLQEVVPNNGLPEWLVPQGQVIRDRVIFSGVWVSPILVMLFLMATSGLLGMILGYGTYRVFVKSERMVFPHFSMQAVIVDSCFKGRGPIRFLTLFMVAGFAITFVQFVVKIFGIETTIVDFSPYLPQGFLFGLALNVAFIALGYFIGARVSLSILIGSLASYVIISPILVNQGIVSYHPDSMQLYMDLLYKFMMSPGVGMMLIAGIFLSVVGMIRTRFKRTPTNSSDTQEQKGSTLGYGELFRFFLCSLVTNKWLLTGFIGTAAPIIAFTYHINFLYPFPAVVSMVFALFFLIAASFFDFVIITKMAGEAGMSTGIQSIIFYMVPLFAAGYKGYTGYLAQPGRSDPFIGSSVVGYAKIKDLLNIDLRSIVKAILIGWLPSFASSVVFILVMWRTVGFGTPLMPCIGFVQNKLICQMFAERSVTGILDPMTFLGGGIVGALLESFTPVSFIGLALGMLLPPFYGIPFGIGGIVRLYTDRKYGNEFFKEKGMLAASGLIAGGIITQVIMSIVLVMSGLVG